MVVDDKGSDIVKVVKKSKANYTSLGLLAK